MDRLVATNSVPSGAADTVPSTGTAQFATDGNPATSTPATQWTAAQYNAIQEELIAILTAAGITPNRANNGQIVLAVQTISAPNIWARQTAGSYTWTPPSWCTSYEAEVVGAGGSGCAGNTTSYRGPGGAAGGRSLGVQSCTPGVPITVTVGAGGAAPSGSTANGNAGSSSSVGAISATGGSGGVYSSAAGGLGGIGSGGAFNGALGDGSDGSGGSAGGGSGDGGGPGSRGGAGVALVPHGPGGGSGGTSYAVQAQAGADGAVIIRY